MQRTGTWGSWWTERSPWASDVSCGQEGMIKTWTSTIPIPGLVPKCEKRAVCKGREPAQVRLVRWMMNTKTCFFSVTTHEDFWMCLLPYTWLPTKRKDRMIFSLAFQKELNPRPLKKLAASILLVHINVCIFSFSEQVCWPWMHSDH